MKWRVYGRCNIMRDAREGGVKVGVHDLAVSSIRSPTNRQVRQLFSILVHHELGSSNGIAYSEQELRSLDI